MRSKVTAHILTDKMSEVIDHPGVGDRCALCCRSEAWKAGSRALSM